MQKFQQSTKQVNSNSPSLITTTLSTPSQSIPPMSLSSNSEIKPKINMNSNNEEKKIEAGDRDRDPPPRNVNVANSSRHQATKTAAVATKLNISNEHVSNIQNLHSTMLDYLSFLKGESKEPPTVNAHLPPHLPSTKPQITTRSDVDIDYKVSIAEKHSLYPQHLNSFEKELAKRLRMVQRENYEMKQLLTLHAESPTNNTHNSPNPQSKDPNHWIKAIQNLISERGSKSHIIGNLLKDKNALLCTPTISVKVSISARRAKHKPN